MIFGLAGGYAWSAMQQAPAAPAPALEHVSPTDPIKASKRKSTAKPAASHLSAEDRAWAARANADYAVPAGSTRAAPRRAASAGRGAVFYAGCNAVRAAGRAPLYRGDPGYRAEMDGDGDGVACEPIRR